MEQPTHISLIIESMDIFDKEPKALIFKRLRTKKSRAICSSTAKINFLKPFRQGQI
jgi:hypothetical protein